jgi:recombination associated protein RdgC
MWFKNIHLFRLAEGLAEGLELTPAQLEEKLAAHQARPCGTTELMTYGWSSPFNKPGLNLVHASNGCMLFAVCKEERILPGSVVREAVQEKIAAIETEQGRTVYRKEKAQLKDEVIFALLPRAFIKRKLTYAYLDPSAGLLVIESSSRNKAEELTVLLRQSLGSLKLAPINTKASPSLTMTGWLLQETIPQEFNLEDSCSMLDPKTGEGLVKYQRHDLTEKEVQAHLQAGKQLTQLALTWQDKLTFVLHEDLSIKRIRCLELIQEKSKESAAETAEEQLDADFTLMSLEFRELFTAIFAAFEGLAE